MEAESHFRQFAKILPTQLFFLRQAKIHMRTLTVSSWILQRLLLQKYICCCTDGRFLLCYSVLKIIKKHFISPQAQNSKHLISLYHRLSYFFFHSQQKMGTFQRFVKRFLVLHAAVLPNLLRWGDCSLAFFPELTGSPIADQNQNIKSRSG